MSIRVKSMGLRNSAVFCVLLVTVTLPPPVPLHADNLEDGLVAYRRRNYEEALRHFNPLAGAGEAEAQYRLAFMYYIGQVVSKDSAAAARWFHKAARQGHAGAQNNLGYLYDTGRGVPKDGAQALSWYLRAASQGDRNAQFNAAVKYDVGDGVAQDD